MPNREHEREAHAEEIERLAEALREEVPVRAEWRARVLEEVDALPMPRRGPSRAVRFTRSTWTLSPVAGIAAAIVFVAIGAGGAFLFLRTNDGTSGNPVATVAPTVPDVRPTTHSSSGGRSVRFVIVAANARRVSLVGDFNGWDPDAMPMQRDENGIWVRDVVLEPGRHVYAFYVDGALQVDPSAPRAAEDDFGIPSSALIVRNAGSD